MRLEETQPVGGIASDLPKETGSRLALTLWRAFARRCPYCGAPGIFCGYFVLREQCSNCGVQFEREDGYFLGAYALNLIVAELLGLGLAIFLLFRTQLSRLDLIWQEILAITLAILFPLIFFPFSRGVWMAMDITFHPPREPLPPDLRAPEDGAGERLHKPRQRMGYA